MAYDLYDVGGYVAPLATVGGLRQLRQFADRHNLYNLQGFLEKGAALITEIFIRELEDIKGASKEVQATIDNLLDALKGKAELAVFVVDGVHNEK